jgi:RNA polymerase sigma factor (sigma-70 family)
VCPVRVAPRAVKKPGPLVIMTLRTSIVPLLATASTIVQRHRNGMYEAFDAPWLDSLGYDMALGYDVVPATLPPAGRLPPRFRGARARTGLAGSAADRDPHPGPEPRTRADTPPDSVETPYTCAPHTARADSDGQTAGLLRRMGALEPGDQLRARLREAVIREHMPTAWHIAARYASRIPLGEDEVHLAYRSLEKAVDGFDPEGGGSFLGYAVPVILREVKASRRDDAGMDAPDRERLEAAALRAGAEQLARHLGRSPAVSELAAATGRTSEGIVELLDAALGPAAAWVDLPEPAAGTVDDRHGQYRMGPVHRERLTALFALLENRAKRVLLMRFLRTMSQEQIAADLGVPPVQVARLQAQSLGRLRAARINPFSPLGQDSHDAPTLTGWSHENTVHPVPRGPGLRTA